VLSSTGNVSTRSASIWHIAWNFSLFAVSSSHSNFSCVQFERRYGWPYNRLCVNWGIRISKWVTYLELTDAKGILRSTVSTMSALLSDEPSIEDRNLRATYLWRNRLKWRLAIGGCLPRPQNRRKRFQTEQEDISVCYNNRLFLSFSCSKCKSGGS